MNKALMAVWDDKSAVYIDHFVSTSVIQAARDFEQESIRKGSNFNLYPKDFHLVQIGEIETNPENLETPLVKAKYVHIAKASDFLIVEGSKPELYEAKFTRNN